MSSVFDPLQKSEEQTGDEFLVFSPETFLDTIEKSRGLRLVAVENAHIGLESRVVVHTKPYSAASERFRLLRIRLQELQAGGNLKTLLLTSPLPKDGKSTVCINLATVLAEQGKQTVLLLEADLRCPVLIKSLGLRPWSGLVKCLQTESDPMSAVRRIEPLGWYLLPAGELVGNPTELFQSEKFAEVLQKLSAYFDWVLIDSPPVCPVADTLALKARTDASLFVVWAGRTPREAVEEAIRHFPPEHVLGIILNGIDERTPLYMDHYFGDG